MYTEYSINTFGILLTDILKQLGGFTFNSCFFASQAIKHWSTNLIYPLILILNQGNKKMGFESELFHTWIAFGVGIESVK